MIWLFGLLSLIPVIWGILHWRGGFTKASKKDRHTRVGDGESAAIIVASIVTATFYVIVGLQTLTNYNGLAKWEAFYEANTKNYEITVDRTASYLSEQTFVEGALIPIEGSIEKIKQAGYVSERIIEWRDAVNDYNLTIASMEYFDSNLIFGSMLPDRVQDMKLLIIK